MKTYPTTIEAIVNSISHNEIVRVEFSGDIADALSEINSLTTDYVKNTENNGDVDICGSTDDGSEFRIRIAIR